MGRKLVRVKKNRPRWTKKNRPQWFSVVGLRVGGHRTGISERGFSCFVCMEWGKRECFLLAFFGMGGR